MEFEPGTFWFLSQHLNPLGHYPQDYARICLNFDNSYLTESRNKSSQDLQKLALSSNPAGIYLFKFKQKKQSKVWNRQWSRSGAFIINFKLISQFVLVFQLFTLSR